MTVSNRISMRVARKHEVYILYIKRPREIYFKRFMKKKTRFNQEKKIQI